MIKRCRTKERKSRQVTSLFKPTVYEAFQKIAYMKQLSVNSLLGEIMEQFVAAHPDLVAQYDKKYPEE